MDLKHELERRRGLLSRTPGTTWRKPRLLGYGGAGSGYDNYEVGKMQRTWFINDGTCLEVPAMASSYASIHPKFVYALVTKDIASKLVGYDSYGPSAVGEIRPFKLTGKYLDKMQLEDQSVTYPCIDVLRHPPDMLRKGRLVIAGQWYGQTHQGKPMYIVIRTAAW